MKLPTLAVIFMSVLIAGCAEPAASNVSTVKPVAEVTAAPLEDKGSIEGTVVDSEVLPIKGVAIILFDGGGPGQDLRGTSSEIGKFTFNDLEPGSYRVLADLAGYESVTQTVDVTAGQVSKAQFTLERVVVRIVRPDFFLETNGTIQGPVVAFQGVNGRESKIIPFPVEPWPLVLYANLTWPCGTVCAGPPETNYLNLEVIDAEGVIMRRCTDQTDAGNNMFFLTCKLDSFASAGEYKVDVFAWEGRDVKWNLQVTVDY